MPEFDVRFAGDSEQGWAPSRADAEESFGLPERVSATSEADAVFEYNRLLGDSPIGAQSPQATERYFVQKVIPQPCYVCDVTELDGLPVIRAQPVV